jgi:uncharacterized protein (DUF2141 family)
MQLTFLPLLAFMALYSQSTQPSQLHLKITNLRNNQGKVRICLYQSDNGFPSHPEKAYRIAKADVQQGRSEATFTDLPLGEYAIALIHDENVNEKLDTNFMGIPKEGYGASNNAGGKFGPPKFEDARFTLDKPVMVMEIKVKYL